MTKIRMGEHTLLIDDADLHLLEGISCRVRQCGSEANPLRYVEFKLHGKTTNLHRLVMGDPEGFVDHINGDGLDNRRVNLRVCSHTENMQNRRMHANNKVGIKGVYFDARRKSYRATIRAFGKKVALGSFSCLQEAAEAYATASIKFHGDFAKA